MADPTATDGDFHVNASSTPIDLAPYPGAGAEDRVERLMPGRCVAAAPRTAHPKTPPPPTRSQSPP